MNIGGYFERDNIFKRIKELESEVTKADFWSDKKNSELVIGELNNLKNRTVDINVTRNKIDNNLELLETMKNSIDYDIYSLIELDLEAILDDVSNIEIHELLNKPYDNLNCILEIHPGAGGTESCDWASMLYRMYLRYSEKHDFKVDVLDTQNGEEAGIKSVSIVIKGSFAYGYLKGEKGIHRLIRISPFDSNKRRHTSFASVDVTPYFENDDIDIIVKDEDIRVDVYRSTGCGGQGVNTTDSAVRITHIPTKIVVTCQNERSQIQNKARCMEVLKNKLYQTEIEKREKEMQNLKGEQKDINFGSQIRTYTMNPYSMVKDHRTNLENFNVSKVLDGDLDSFINEYLKVIGG